MGDAEFDALSPATLSALRRAWAEQQKRIDFRFGVLASLTANLHRDPKRKRKPYQPADFFPSLADAPTRRRQRMTNDEILAACRLMIGAPPPSKQKPPM